MASYRIVCVTTAYPHRHIVGVGIGGTAAAPLQRLTIEQVGKRLDKGDRFYTVSASTGRESAVRKERCSRLGCDALTLVSADAMGDGSLDRVTVCPDPRAPSGR